VGDTSPLESEMNRTLIATATLALVAATGVAHAASWTTIVPPGTYGRVAVGGYPAPPLVVSPQPTVLQQDAVESPLGWFLQGLLQPQEPVYMWVPSYQQ